MGLALRRRMFCWSGLGEMHMEVRHDVAAGNMVEMEFGGSEGVKVLLLARR